jgi:hypothetical protein
MSPTNDLLTVPLEARFAYDAGRNMFFLNMEGISLVSEDEVEEIGTAVGKRLAAIGKKVQMVINYDNFHLAPGPERRLHRRGPRAGRALLRQRDQVHDQLLHAAQAHRAAVPLGTGPAHL